MSEAPLESPPPGFAAGAIDRLRLDALRYATAPEAATYLAVMRVFTAGTAGLMSDLSAGEVGERLVDEYGIELDDATIEERLGRLVEHGNLARSPREAKARTIEEYLRTRARFQLTAVGERTHRAVEELLGATDSVREVSTEMLGAIHEGLAALSSLTEAEIAAAEPDVLSGRIGTIFAQHRDLVESTREFYSYLGQVLGRYDLGRTEFAGFKTVLIDYLQRFVDEIARHMPQIGDRCAESRPGSKCWSPGRTTGRAWSISPARPPGAPPGSPSPTGRGCGAGSWGAQGRNPTRPRCGPWPPVRCARWCSTYVASSAIRDAN